MNQAETITVLPPIPSGASGTPPIQPCPKPKGWPARPTIRVAWLALGLALATPPAGLGIRLCWLRDTGIPCPGCGLTRSLSCAAHGLFLESWQYHPFGPILLVFFTAVALASLAPKTWRARWAASAQARPGLCSAALAGSVIAFAGFGFVRAMLQLAGICQFNV